MKFSEYSLFLLAARESNVIKSNAQFWKSYSTIEAFTTNILNNKHVAIIANRLRSELEDFKENQGIICFFDEDFPIINVKVKNDSEKPYLLFYQGNYALINDLNNNVAVIGLTTPSAEIRRREQMVVRKLIDKNLTVVSGLALGCDTIAHQTSVELKGKTIAILPSSLDKIYPSENKKLADEILSSNGLLISEYFSEPSSKHEAIRRFVERDRLQAMFSKAIILIASYRQGDGDSGSRHAIAYGQKYGVDCFVMYNAESDTNDKMFGLNQDLLFENNKHRVNTLQSSSIDVIFSMKNPDLIRTDSKSDYKQLSWY